MTLLYSNVGENKEEEEEDERGRGRQQMRKQVKAERFWG